MVYDVLLRLASLGHLRDDRARERCIEAIVRCLATINLEFLRAAPDTPSLYHSGVRYSNGPPRSPDPWPDIVSILPRRFANCAGIVPWRLAELWFAGYTDARPMARIQRAAGNRIVFHVLIRYGESTEDPSKNLGMPT